MPAIIKNNFRRHSAKQFVQTVVDSASDAPNLNYYLFVGKPIPWTSSWGLASQTAASTNADLYPPVPLDTTFVDNRTWDEMLGLKKITPGDVSLVIPRSNWRPNTVYATYNDNDPELFNHPSTSDAQKLVGRGLIKAGNFYALNSLNQLFVCLYNNNDAVSTVEPSYVGSATSLFTASDGYVWKFITAITSGDAVKFLTDAWIPIKTLKTDNNTGQWEVQNDAINNSGSVLAAVVTNLDSATATWPDTIPASAGATITILTNNTCKLNTSPSNVDGAYIGYELKLTYTVSGASVSSKHTITGYDTTFAGNNNVLQIDGTFPTGLVGTVSCSIQPKLIVYTNSISSKPLAFTPKVDPSSKRISHIQIDSSGEFATFVSVDVAPLPNHTQSLAVLPKIHAILSPVGGLGADPEKDLGAFYVMISTQLKYAEGGDPENSGYAQPNLTDFPVKNDYRQIGILKNAVQNLESVPAPLASDSTLNATKKIKVSFSDVGIPEDPGFKSDEEVTIAKTSDLTTILGRAKIIDFKFFDKVNEADPESGQITIVQTPETKYVTFNSAESYTFVGLVTGAKAVAAVTPADPSIKSEELKRFHGEIIYLENRRPVLRALDQIEDIKTIIEF